VRERGRKRERERKRTRLRERSYIFICTHINTHTRVHAYIHIGAAKFAEVPLGNSMLTCLHLGGNPLRVKFLLKTDCGYLKDTGVTLFTVATPANPPLTSNHTVRASFLDGIQFRKGGGVGDEDNAKEESAIKRALLTWPLLLG